MHSSVDKTLTGYVLSHRLPRSRDGLERSTVKRLTVAQTPNDTIQCYTSHRYIDSVAQKHRERGIKYSLTTNSKYDETFSLTSFKAIGKALLKTFEV